MLCIDVMHCCRCRIVTCVRHKFAQLWVDDRVPPGEQYPLKNFGDVWSTFSASTNFWSRISRTILVGSPQNFAWLGVWPVDISSPNLVNFDSGVRRCHAATRISRHLFTNWIEDCYRYQSVVSIICMLNFKCRMSRCLVNSWVFLLCMLWRWKTCCVSVCSMWHTRCMTMHWRICKTTMKLFAPETTFAEQLNTLRYVADAGHL